MYTYFYNWLLKLDLDRRLQVITTTTTIRVYFYNTKAKVKSKIPYIIQSFISETVHLITQYVIEESHLYGNLNLQKPLFSINDATLKHNSTSYTYYNNNNNNN